MWRTAQKKIQEDVLHKLYTEECLTDLEIANTLSCNKQSVCVARKKFGIGRITPTDRNSSLINITPWQEEVLRGSVLGDAYIDPTGAITISHGPKQFAYLEWLYQNLTPYFGETKVARTNKRIRSCTHNFGLELRKEYYPEGTKIVTPAILNKLSPLSIAVWFMDDGQVLPQGNQSRLATCSFTEEENELIVKYFNSKWGILGDIRRYDGYRQIYFNKENTHKLVSLIRPHIPLCMRYKIWFIKNFTIYLSGGMENKKDFGRTWRVDLTKKLNQYGHTALDPVKIEQAEGETLNLQHSISELKLQGNFEEIRKLVRESFFRKDMKAIQHSDCLVLLYDSSVQKGAGSHAEAWESFREGRPVYLVTKFSTEDIPSWLIGETTNIFSNFEDFLNHVNSHDKMIIDMEKAQKTRDWVFKGIYK